MPTEQVHRNPDVRKLKLTKTSVGIGWEIGIETQGDHEHASDLLKEMIALAAEAVTEAEESIKDITATKRK